MQKHGHDPVLFHDIQVCKSPFSQYVFSSKLSPPTPSGQYHIPLPCTLGLTQMSLGSEKEQCFNPGIIFGLLGCKILLGCLNFFCSHNMLILFCQTIIM